MAEDRTCEIGVSLAPFTFRPRNDASYGNTPYKIRNICVKFCVLLTVHLDISM